MARRKKIHTTSPNRLLLFLLVAGVTLAVNWYRQHTEQAAATPVPQEQPQPSGQSEGLTLCPGHPGIGPAAEYQGKLRAKGLEIPAYLTDREEEILQHEGFTISYNRTHLLPNWVAWVLTAERTRGTETRAENFQPDPTIRRGPAPQLADYRRSGYDRGHMCPAADCKHSREAMNACFYLSNMCPQTHALNAGDWQELETRCRRWAVAYDSVFIVCGPVLEKRVRYAKIGENRVTVPREFFKVVLRFTPEGGAEAIGFLFPNDDTKQPLARYAVPVDSVEVRTGINFFSKLPRVLERKVEAEFDVSRWKGIRERL